MPMRLPWLFIVWKGYLKVKLKISGSLFNLNCLVFTHGGFQGGKAT
ncbi:hypothetical protein EIKCOROL_00514 [Eikenella corrodens ATCC 23834]|uniref:Uncharacterized protein n=1 Tax=Eikenella corrodens ATCC 23834 TaxID=546274 RepID=C0DT37_EIKCO|nr:hypothetical protein EIKCOROL_00514 [Eikenella corrodens ATCC 23834]